MKAASPLKRSGDHDSDHWRTCPTHAIALTPRDFLPGPGEVFGKGRWAPETPAGSDDDEGSSLVAGAPELHLLSPGSNSSTSSLDSSGTDRTGQDAGSGTVTPLSVAGTAKGLLSDLDSQSLSEVGGGSEGETSVDDEEDFWARMEASAGVRSAPGLHDKVRGSRGGAAEEARASEGLENQLKGALQGHDRMATDYAEMVEFCNEMFAPCLPAACFFVALVLLVLWLLLVLVVLQLAGPRLRLDMDMVLKPLAMALLVPAALIIALYIHESRTCRAFVTRVSDKVQGLKDLHRQRRERHSARRHARWALNRGSGLGGGTGRGRHGEVPLGPGPTTRPAASLSLSPVRPWVAPAPGPAPWAGGTVGGGSGGSGGLGRSVAAPATRAGQAAGTDVTAGSPGFGRAPANEGSIGHRGSGGRAPSGGGGDARVVSLSLSPQRPSSRASGGGGEGLGHSGGGDDGGIAARLFAPGTHPVHPRYYGPWATGAAGPWFGTPGPGEAALAGAATAARGAGDTTRPGPASAGVGDFKSGFRASAVEPAPAADRGGIRGGGRGARGSGRPGGAGAAAAVAMARGRLGGDGGGWVYVEGGLFPTGHGPSADSGSSEAEAVGSRSPVRASTAVRSRRFTRGLGGLGAIGTGSGSGGQWGGDDSDRQPESPGGGF